MENLVIQSRLKALREAMDETMHAETVGGNEADDEPQDALAAEYEEKNG